MDFRVVVSDPKSGKAYQVELKDPGASKLLGKRIGDKIEGDILGMPGIFSAGYGRQRSRGSSIRAQTFLALSAERSCSHQELDIIQQQKAERSG